VCVYARARERERERESGGVSDGSQSRSELRKAERSCCLSRMKVLGDAITLTRDIFMSVRIRTRMYIRVCMYTRHMLYDVKRACARVIRRRCARYRLTLFFLWISYLLSPMVYTGHRFKRDLFNLLRLSRGRERKREKESVCVCV